MKKENITIDDLAVMVQRGFEETAKKSEIDKQFQDVETRLERIENLILIDYRERIEKLEAEMKELRNLMALN